MRKYEAMIVVGPAFGGEQKGAILSSVNEMFTKNEATNASHSEMGKKRLSYEINKNKEGYYLLYQFEMEPEQVRKMKRSLTLNDFVLTSLIVQEASFSNANIGSPKSEKGKEKKGSE